MKLEVTPYEIAERFIGMKEVPGSVANPQILAMLKRNHEWPQDDSVPWCAAFVDYIAFLLGLHSPESLRARSWLSEKIVAQYDAQIGFDIIILKRGRGFQPGPEVLKAPGHVGFFAGWTKKYVKILGGNQNDTVKISHYKKSRILGVRRLTL